MNHNFSPKNLNNDTSLTGEFTERFSSIKDVIHLLNAMELSLDFKFGKSSDDYVTFLTRIKDLDPNEPSLSEDDLDASWGHY